jgi:hypothetical protein
VQRGAGVGVESLALRLRLEQAVLVGLPVHGDQRLPDARQRGGRDRGATQEAAGATLGGDLAAEQQQVTFDLTTVLVCNRGDLCTGADHALDAGGARSGAYGAGVGATAEQQPERGHQHGLAGAGLAGDHGQAGAELQHRLVDHPERADPDLLDHAVTVRRCVGAARAPHASLRRGGRT